MTVVADKKERNMIFTIIGEKPGHPKKETFLYDNETNTLSHSEGTIYEFPKNDNDNIISHKLVVPFSKDEPLKKSKDIRILKIQLGLSCNYSCDYCSQRFVERAPETNKKDIDDFMAKLENLNIKDEGGTKIEFWGGEPFVYWKTLKPLVAAMNEKYVNYKNKPQFSVITNGSLLNDEICDWLFDNNFSVAISHDGPGQFVRGPDPIEDPKIKDTWLKFYRRMKRANRNVSFNSMLNVHNVSRKVVQDWFIDFTGDFSIVLGEGGMIDAYDADGQKNALQTKADHFKFRQTAFSDIVENKAELGFNIVPMKLNGFREALLSHKPASSLGQKCGMDNEDIVAIDLRGDVITCQNVSTVEISNNMEPHKGGNVINMEEVEIRTATHWRNRPHCSECPVVHLCQGACMFLEGENWDTSCANSYSDNIAFFAAVFLDITGFTPVFIENEHLPDVRRDIFGTTIPHTEKVKKGFPIKVVVEAKYDVIDEVKVYKKAEVISS
ncbi:MAG: radical SAM protein [Bacteroidota bacterium]